MDSLSILGIVALIWTGWQEIRMFKMCKNCPYYNSVIEKKI